MSARKFLALLGATCVGAVAALTLTPPAGAAKSTGRDGAAERAAKAFLASLPADLRGEAHLPFSSSERTTWYFVPRDRIGVSMLKLDDTQSEALGPLLATALSAEGLLTARGVVKHENILRRVETESGIDATRRDPGRYYTTIFGEPSANGPWSWRFEGHHLSVNVTQIPNAPPIVAPMFVGANPARVLTGPNTGFRLLAAEEDLGRELAKMLTPAQFKTAEIRDTAFSEIVTGNDPKVQPLELAGLAVADMDSREKEQVWRIVSLYLDRMNPASTQEVRERIERAGVGKVHFAWAGGTEPGQAHYYRVHGPTFLIEYDDTQNDANHIHTVYRDLQHDFGGDLLRAHYSRDHGAERTYLSSR